MYKSRIQSEGLARGIDLGVISLYMVFKVTRLNEMTKGEKRWGLRTKPQATLPVSDPLLGQG